MVKNEFFYNISEICQSRFFGPNALIFPSNKKNWNSNFEQFQQLLFHTIPPPMKFIFWF